jgi:hypothetical protein
MASIIRIKRSSGTSLPNSLQWGELAYVTGIGSASGTSQYKDRVYLGDDGTNVLAVGGRYYTSMMDHIPGTVSGVTNSRNSDGGIVVILDNTRKVDQWNVDNLRLDGNTFSSQNTDGDIILDPNGTGEINIVDDTFLSFGTDKDSKIEYDENGTNQLTFTGADIRINIPTQSADKDTGSLIVEGGVGIEKNLNVGGNASVAGVTTFTGSVTIGDIKVEENIISTIPGSNGILYIDPYPDGLSNEGTVVIKGDLQVDGTTTSVNSTVVSINDPIIILGDVTSKRTVMSPVASGVSTITLDSVIGINTGDIVQGSASLPNSGLTTITNYNTTTKIITIEDSKLKMCEEKLRHEIEILTITKDTQIEKLKFDLKQETENCDYLIKEKDKELERVYGIVKKQNRNLTPLWLSIGFAAGVITSFGTIYGYETIIND